MARPTNLTEDVLDRVVGLVQSGMTEDEALAAAGMGDRTRWRWRKRAQERPGSIYGTYRERIDRALAEQTSIRLRSITTAGLANQTTTTTITTMERVGVDDDGAPVWQPVEQVVHQTTKPPDWRANAWVLERINPRFRLRQEVEAVVQHIPADMLQRGIGELLRIVNDEDVPSVLRGDDDAVRALMPPSN